MNEDFGIYYQTHGAGYPVVLIGGLSADHMTWLSVAALLKAHYKVIIFDNRGIGKTQKDDKPCTTEIMAADVIRLLDHLNIEQAHIVGHSLGGCVAQQLAIHYPSRVDKLVLYATKAKTKPVQELYTKVMMGLMQANVTREIIVKNSLCWLFSNEFLSEQANIDSFVSLSLLKPAEQSRETYHYQASALLTHDTVDQLAQITASTLIIVGEEDMVAPPKNSAFLHNKIANSQLQVIPKGAHLLHIEQTQTFCKSVLEFLH